MGEFGAIRRSVVNDHQPKCSSAYWLCRLFSSAPIEPGPPRSQIINIKHVWESGCLCSFTAVNERREKKQKETRPDVGNWSSFTASPRPHCLTQHKPIPVGSCAHSELKGLKTYLCLDTQAFINAAPNDCKQRFFCQFFGVVCGLFVFLVCLLYFHPFVNHNLVGFTLVFQSDQFKQRQHLLWTITSCPLSAFCSSVKWQAVP